MFSAALLVTVLIGCSSCSRFVQQPLKSSSPATDEVLTRFLEAHLIPEVVDTFQPEFLLHVNWTNETAAQLGNSIRPSLLKDPPQNLSLIRPAPAAVTATNTLNLVLALTDPDALSREDPVWSEMCHWITYVRSKGSQARSKTKEIMSYFPPGPPPKTGSHRYVILALTPINGTTQKLHLSKPLDRKHWGYQGVRVGVRRWAQENGLRVIAGNFFYAQNEEQ